METNPAQQKLRQAMFAFWSNLAFTLFALVVFIKSVDQGSAWRIVCSGIGFVVFAGLAVLVYLQMRKLRKGTG